MKIEIGESLTSSYLKHVMGCRIIESNWKTSGNWVITDHEKARANNFFQKIINSGNFNKIFKESTFQQLLKQAEIDVLGINTTESIVYGVDIAFHGAGLNYGSKEETAERILKKIFRTLFVMQIYFDEYTHFQSLFITPKTNPATQSLIDDLIKKARTLVVDENITIDFITNDVFFDEILDSTINASKTENDTSELFLRTIKLLELDSRKEKITPVLGKSEKKFISNNKKATNKSTKNGMKIGQYVRHTFRNAFRDGLISSEEIHNLQNPTYSIDKFNSRFEILRLKSRDIKDTHGRTRYYSQEYFCENYYLTSQWVESQWVLYLKWLESIGFYDKNY
jgi:hypothetical protein